MAAIGSTRSGSGLRGNLPLLARIAAAVFGGYALANVTAIALAAVLPLAQADAVMTGVLASFAFYCLAVLWAFAARSALSAWAGIAGWTLVFSVIAWSLGGAA